MSGHELVRPSRDGDQFHYSWAARRCLQLLDHQNDLVAVTIEGASTGDVSDPDNAGDELIDVGLYFGSESNDSARLVEYIQLKHSTRNARTQWTVSGLAKTLKGFAARYKQLVNRFTAADVEQRFRFEFTTNRPIDPRIGEAAADLASGSSPRHSTIRDNLLKYTELEERDAARFFTLFRTEGGEDDLWAQRNLLTAELVSYLPDADYDAPVQLKELVTRKATTEFESDPSIRRHDVLRALKATEELLRPAPCRLEDVDGMVQRVQETEILDLVLTTDRPIILHADGGVGKSVLAARLANAMPPGSEAVLYDCFGNGLYRTSLHFRHRHRDACVQICNELSARGLCHPLIPTAHAEPKMYMRALCTRLAQAARQLRAHHPDANLCVIIDAADNAELAASEQAEPGGFVRDLIRTPLPHGVRLVFTCRTHRRSLLNPPPTAIQVELLPFVETETAEHLRRRYPKASDSEVAEFDSLTSSNPRVQALALAQGLPLHDMLKQLGPEPTTAEEAISELLERALARVRDQATSDEAMQLDVMCQALAVLRPLVPVRLLAELSQIDESAIRSFVLDLGRPLRLNEQTLHFVDEPAETWFRERFFPDQEALSAFLSRLRPLAARSSYVAAVLPQLLLQAGKLDELVDLALSGEGLPVESPLDRRDVELQRLTFALSACVRLGRHLAAAKLALKAGGECAGEQRQNALITRNTDLAAALMAPDRIQEIVARRVLGTSWMGSHHAYDAGLLSGQEDLHPDSASHLRMANDWLNAWSRRPNSVRHDEEVTERDVAEIALAALRVKGAKSAARFLRGWTPRHFTLDAGETLGRRLVDLGRFDQLDALAAAAGSDVWLILGLASSATAVGHTLPAAALERALRLLADRRVTLSPSQRWQREWALLDGICATVEIGLQVLPSQPDSWAGVLRRYLPASPPSALARQHGFDRSPVLRAYCLEAALRGERLDLSDLAPADIRKQLDGEKGHSRTYEADTFQVEVGALLPWFTLSAEIASSRGPSDLTNAIGQALEASAQAEKRSYREYVEARQTIPLEWLRVLVRSGSEGAHLDAYRSWIDEHKELLRTDTLTAIGRVAARTTGLEAFALEHATATYTALEGSRENAESRADSYVSLARAVLLVSPEDAAIYFDRAVEIASRIGDENLDRWRALLNLAEAAADREEPRPRTAQRLSRVAELTYQYVERDKYFDWERSVSALCDLCGPSAITILSRWRDRRFGSSARLLSTLVDRLVGAGQLSPTTPVLFSPVQARWDRVADLLAAVAAESDVARRARIAQLAYRYARLVAHERESWNALETLRRELAVELPDLERLLSATSYSDAEEDEPAETHHHSVSERQTPDWDAIFEDLDLADPIALRAAYGALTTYDPPFELQRFYQEALNRVEVGREPALVRAIAAWSDFDIFKAHNLVQALHPNLANSIALRRATRDAVLAACERAPQYIYRSGWPIGFPFERLQAEGIVSSEDVVQATLSGFTARTDNLDAGELFHMLEALSARLLPAEASEALEYGLDLLDDALRPEDGDGAWRPELQPPESVVDALAGYIWGGLGSPEASERWQFAHVVRSAVELECSELLTALVAIARNGEVGPFADPGLEFYRWHARQWFLLGLARGAIDMPGAARTSTPLLLECLREEHILIREFAAQTLRSLVNAREFDPGGVDNLDLVNHPQLPEQSYTGWPIPIEKDQPAEEPPDDEKYYFGIDIGPYWFKPLGRAFGLTSEAIERRAREALRDQMGWAHGLSWREDARRTRKLFDEGETQHSHGSLPRTDDLTSYHGYHAMMIVAARLLRERPVLRNTEDSVDDFRDWMSRYVMTRTDGKWLADRRDPCFIDTPSRREYRDANWRWTVAASDLDAKLATDDGMTVLWGDWTVGDSDHRESVTVRSALASRTGVSSLIASAQNAAELGRVFLPRAGDESIDTGPLKLRGWVSDVEIHARLDEADPWSRGLRFPGPAPSDECIAALKLSTSADDRRWASDGGGVLRSESWTQTWGYGRDEETIPGDRLSANAAFLQHLLSEYAEYRLVLSVEVQRRRPRYTADDAIGTYTQPYVRFYMMGEDGVAHALKSSS